MEIDNYINFSCFCFSLDANRYFPLFFRMVINKIKWYKGKYQILLRVILNHNIIDNQECINSRALQICLC